MNLAMAAFLYFGARAPVVAGRLKFDGVATCGGCGKAYAADRMLERSVKGQAELDADRKRPFCGRCCRRMGVR